MLSRRFRFYAQHLIHREPDGALLFHTNTSRKTYLDKVNALRRELSCHVFGYCLMPNHVHILLDAGDRAEDLTQLVRGLDSLHLVRRRHRTSSFDTRFTLSPITSDDHFLTVARYIDLNPVRAKMVPDPQQFRWSSYRTLIGLRSEPRLDTAIPYCALGKTLHERQQRYREFVEKGMLRLRRRKTHRAW
jgi:putative transposase